jgi:hypothetical protein
MFLGDMMQSEDPLQAEIEPVPEDMQALADHLKKQNPPSDVSSYSYRLALLGQVIYQISPIHFYFLNVLQKVEICTNLYKNPRIIEVKPADNESKRIQIESANSKPANGNGRL